MDRRHNGHFDSGGACFELELCVLEAILFDLDDTLLHNDMQAFIPRYLDLLADHARERLNDWDKQELIAAVVASTHAMMSSSDGQTSNREVFWQHFEGLTGLDMDRDEAFFERFYLDQYRALRTLTREVAGARELFEQCRSRGYQLIVATNPVYPRQAIIERLAWANLDHVVDDLTLITSYENMHATKPHPAYYLEILQHVGCSPAAAVMVGNDETADIEPARAAGLHTFQVGLPPGNGATGASTAVARAEQKRPLGYLRDEPQHGQGALGDLLKWLDACFGSTS